MNKTTVLILLGVAWCFSTINAQDQRPMHEWCYMQQKGMTFQAINALMEAKHKGKSSSKKSENYSREYKQYKRWATMWKYRVDADGNFVSPMHTYNEWLKIQKDTDRSRSSAGANWSSLGPSTLPSDTSATYTGLGRLNAIAFEPGNNNTIWVGSPSGGLWKSTTGGTSWSPMTDGLPIMGISDIVIDHSNVNTMYIATGDADGQHTPSIGVMKSTNGGATWATTGLNFTKDSTVQVPHIVMHPSTSTTLLATSNKGIYKTINGGTTWTLTYTGKTHAIMYGAGSSTVMYATADGGYDAQWNPISAKILKSTNGGDTWADITPAAIQNSNSEKVEIAVTAADPDFLFAYGNDNTAVTSSNGGTAWSTMANFPTQFSAQGTYNTAIAIAPNNKDLLMVGGVNGWRSTNGGTTWEVYLDGYWSQGSPYFYVHSDHHMFKFMPGSNTIMFACHDGGVHKGDVTASTPWTDLSSGLGITQHYGLGLAGNNASIVIAGAQDNDAIRYTGSGTWATVFGPVDGVDGVVDYSSPTLIGYATKQEGDFVRTTDGWANQDYLNLPNGADFVWPLLIDPVTPTVLYSGGDGVYKSTNRGDTWTLLSATMSDMVQELAVAPSNPSVIFGSSDDYNTQNSALFATTNGGTSWTTLTGPHMGYITGIAFDPSNAQTVYVTYGGYTSGSKVFKSTNGGAAWTNISTGLPNLPINCVTTQTGAGGDMYVGTDIGVYHRDNTSSSWTAFNTNLPNVIVKDLEISYANNKLRAATFGRGVWESDLNTVATNIERVEAAQDVMLKAYPNPTTGLLNIEIAQEKWMPQQFDVVVYNLTGGVVYNQTNVKRGVHTIDMADLADGVYFVTIKTPHLIKTERFQLMKK